MLSTAVGELSTMEFDGLALIDDTVAKVGGDTPARGGKEAAGVKLGPVSGIAGEDFILVAATGVHPVD